MIVKWKGPNKEGKITTHVLKDIQSCDCGKRGLHCFQFSIEKKKMFDWFIPFSDVISVRIEL